MVDRRDHSLDVLAARATEGITASEARELELLLEEFQDIDVDDFDLAAAALTAAYTRPIEMPAELRAKVTQEAMHHVGAPSTPEHAPLLRLEQARPATDSHTAASPEVGTRRRVELRTPGPTDSRGFRLGWFLAAAAVVLAVLGWWPRLQSMRADSPTEVAGVESYPAAEARLTLLATATDLLQKEWSATEDPAAVGARGDVVWSDTRNEGYMRIEGLAPNDARQFQYQLWVFDKNRDDRYPVDGGVFDIPESGEIVVPIDPKIHVDEAVLFAITVEPPGGVVVSNRERIVLLAQKG